jgi:hypothetical protein
VFFSLFEYPSEVLSTEGLIEIEPQLRRLDGDVGLQAVFHDLLYNGEVFICRSGSFFRGGLEEVMILRALRLCESDKSNDFSTSLFPPLAH